MAKKRAVSEAPGAQPTTGRLGSEEKWFREVRDLVRSDQASVARTVNSALVLLYWQVGRRIQTELLEGERAIHGDEVCSRLANKLALEFGSAFSFHNLTLMAWFAETFPDWEIVAALSQELGWGHFVEIVPLETERHREFYAETCRAERWSVPTLKEKIEGRLFERTAASREPTELAGPGPARPREPAPLSSDQVFRDPHFLRFLGLADVYGEKDLKAAVLPEIERFLLEFGTGFALLARRGRIVVDGKDFDIDLLFYHRRLRRLVAVDLKLSAFQAADEGRIEVLLRWLENHESEPGEGPPIGLVLGLGKGEPLIELLQLDQSGVREAPYPTELPPKALLRKKLKDAVGLARRRLKGD